MSGFETARLIKEHDKKMKIIICSNKFDREFLLAVLSLKLDGYLPGYGNQPVIKETLDTVIENKSYFHYGVGHQQLKNLTAYQYLQLLPPVNKKYSMNDN
jgi:DNA-binding NarL/FixJ family response regulator